MVPPTERRPVDETTRSSDRAQLSALSTTLDDLSTRITDVAGRYQGTTQEDVSHRLYEVERSLLTASRQLAKVMRTLR
jgi:hypothetical protein